MVDLKILELIYRNSETEDEISLALEKHNISMDELVDIAMEQGWDTNPIAIKNAASGLSGDSILVPADSLHIENSNKASVRRLHRILEYAITKFQLEMVNMTTPAIISGLDTISKVREKLTKLEYPLYGLSTMEPVTPPNPIHIFLDNKEETPPGEKGD